MLKAGGGVQWGVEGGGVEGGRWRWEGDGEYTRNTLSELHTQDYNKLRAYFT